MNYIPSPYKHKRTQKITGIVIHTTVGSYAGTLKWFQNNPSTVSAHYVIKEDGSEVTQMVPDDYVAYHAGTVSKPTTKVFIGGNPNEYTLGIENADSGKPHDIDRSKQYPTLITLVADLCKKHNIPCDRDHICRHSEIRSTKTCPGNLVVDYVVAGAQKVLKGESPQESMSEEVQKFVTKYKVKTLSEASEMFDRELAFLKDERVKTATLEKNNAELKEEYDKFILTIVEKLNPVKPLPAITDKNYALALVDEVVKSESDIRRELKNKEDEWIKKEQALEEENRQLEQQVKDLKDEMEKLEQQLGRLKKHLATIEKGIEQNKEDKAQLEPVKSLFSLVRKWIQR